LRGHFPGEVEALANSLGGAFDALVVAPFFEEGGRYTIGDVHYVQEGNVLVPAGLTPYARDATFGYRSSNLRQWIEEKTEGRVAAESVASVSIDDLRRGGPERVANILRGLDGGATCIVNAAGYRDLEVFVLGLLAAEERGKRFLYRTAASFVAVRAGISRRQLLEPAELDLPNEGGLLFVIGSHVPLSTEQLTRLLNTSAVAALKVRVERLLADGERAEEVERVRHRAEDGLSRGDHVAVYTSRELVSGASGRESLAIAGRISASVVDIVRGIGVRPRAVVAKGGITSSDVATDALGMTRVTVLGQLLPGVPVWKMGEGSRWPGLVYVIVPGNVGGPDALARLAAGLAVP
jgi:uncharacterized protein YgbK (DUF1537 family)